MLQVGADGNPSLGDKV